MEGNTKIKHIVVFESDNIQIGKLVTKFIEEIGCEIKMNNTIVREETEE